MKPPKSGLPKIPSWQLLAIRVPLYGLCDSGRGFYKRLDRDSRDVGFRASAIIPAFYFYNLPSEEDPEEEKTVAVLTTHVDDLLFAYLDQGAPVMGALVGRFDMGSEEQDEFRYCGKAFKKDVEGISIDVIDNTRRIKPIAIGNGRSGSEPCSASDMAQLRSVVGSLSWIARQGRPDLLYQVSRLQSETKHLHATVATLRETNKTVELAGAHRDQVKLRYPYRLVEWDNVGVLSVSE